MKGRSRATAGASQAPVVAAALAGRADVLVTGDKDLIEAAGGRELAVMSPRDLWESLHDGDH